ncbi:hypothetical protein E2562_037974 [Oryza meyeriana var. granulata]|uniref:SKP1 component POZ domain-containing protein n=1 Tax=Oryza meyeriana var. granulata TaxID=110450 RepID=A0A6G1CM26_9ORYZ|nr:hypothetical protein E2562_037974 [Oryza meyeriana var. granulata]
MLRSSDGEYFRVPVREAMGSETLAETITTRMDEGDYVDGCVIPLASVDSSTLARVIEYLKMMYDAHCGRATSEATAQRWGRLFIEETDTILDLLSAADYLRIPYLLNLTSKNAARKLSGKSADEHIDSVKSSRRYPDWMTKWIHLNQGCQRKLQYK